MSIEVVEEHRCFGGNQLICRHTSNATGTSMRFAIFLPTSKPTQKNAVLWFLPGLTCTEENFIVKSGAQRYAYQHEMILIATDTSPRGADIEGEDESYDFGSGAGFYVDATAPPWDRNYRMYSYIASELQSLVVAEFPVDRDRQAITGHSMGGHGALTIGLKNPHLFRSISAFSPICSPMNCPWGQKALSGYLADDVSSWKQYDAVELVKSGCRSGEILVDQGDSDSFLADQLKPELLTDVCRDAGQQLTFRMQPGYDHSYFFVASFIEDHIKFHHERLQLNQ